jgi:hypothetical protein
LLTRVDEPTAEHRVHHHGVRQGQEQPNYLQYKVLGVAFLPNLVASGPHYLQRKDTLIGVCPDNK